MVLLVPADVAGVFGTLLALKELDDLCRREGVGCVAPVSWCVGFGSEMSTGRSEAEVEVEECDALLATLADCARRAVSSRVSLLTYVHILECVGLGMAGLYIPQLPVLSHIPDTTPPLSKALDAELAVGSARC